ncbi:DUF1360 domain-containing protein [uncultured Jatrophihabitans sp.]|uniref:DUF1360 domain-containing protein n=1 Tax=uncultured Jatrophihabitans sp. TaxID=1610747 RepID=UPI0035C9C407
MSIPTWLLVVLTVFAVARLTRLVTKDVVTQPVRAWIVARRLDGHDDRDDSDPIVYLIHCRWCASIWLAAPVSVAVWLWPGAWWVQIPLLALTASHGTALLAGLEDD